MGTKTCGLPLLFNFEPHPYGTNHLSGSMCFAKRGAPRSLQFGTLRPRPWNKPATRWSLGGPIAGKRGPSSVSIFSSVVIGLQGFLACKTKTDKPRDLFLFRTVPPSLARVVHTCALVWLPWLQMAVNLFKFRRPQNGLGPSSGSPFTPPQKKAYPQSESNALGHRVLTAKSMVKRMPQIRAGERLPPIGPAPIGKEKSQELKN